MSRLELSLWTWIEIIVASVAAVIGCSILWSISNDARGDDSFSDIHHAFNFNVVMVIIAIILQVVAAISTSRYIRVVHFLGMGMVAFLLSNQLSIVGFNEETGDVCTPTTLHCIPEQPVSLGAINYIRVASKSDNMSDGDKKFFSGAFFIWIALLLSLSIPTRFDVHGDRFIMKILFLIGTYILSGIGIVILAQNDVSGFTKYGSTSYSNVLFIMGISVMVLTFSTLAVFSSNHAVALFTASYLGLYGWTIPSRTLLVSELVDLSNGSDEDQDQAKVGGFFCFMGVLSATVAVASVLGGEDSGNRYKQKSIENAQSQGASMNA